MHIYFGGIGGTGIGPLALIAHQAGFKVSGSDKQQSVYTDYLLKKGITDIYFGQSNVAIAAKHRTTPIDWYVYSSALPKENPDHPELQFVTKLGIKHSKRDEFLSYLLAEKKLRLLAVAGTHGKTTTTAMLIWLLKKIDMPLSYSVGAKISFGEMGCYEPGSTYFAYECDEYDHNFLSFTPYISVISGIDWDHADIYPTRQSYYEAFRQFIGQSEKTILWRQDADRLSLQNANNSVVVLDDDTPLRSLRLAGEVNRRDAWLVVQAVQMLTKQPIEELISIMNDFPGVSRRFETIIPRLVSDYAHTPKKIEGALQLAHEVAKENVVVVYEGLHNTRQHFIRQELAHLFDSVKRLYVVPSYLAREDTSLQLLSPQDLIGLTSQPQKGIASELDSQLKANIQKELDDGNLVLCLTAGGGGSLDEWLRKEFKPGH